MKSKKVISKKESAKPYSFEGSIENLGSFTDSITSEKMKSVISEDSQSPLLLNQSHHSDFDQNSSALQREALSYSPYAPPDNEYEKY